jgi:hypothetical protein
VHRPSEALRESGAASADATSGFLRISLKLSELTKNKCKGNSKVEKITLTVIYCYISFAIKCRFLSEMLTVLKHKTLANFQYAVKA